MLSPQTASSAAPLRSRYRSAALVGVAILVGTALCVWRDRAVDREIGALSPADRRALIERTQETLRTVCARVPGPELTERCRASAELVMRFPECDGACQALASRFTSKPTK